MLTCQAQNFDVVTVTKHMLKMDAEILPSPIFGYQTRTQQPPGPPLQAQAAPTRQWSVSQTFEKARGFGNLRDKKFVRGSEGGS